MVRIVWLQDTFLSRTLTTWCVAFSSCLHIAVIAPPFCALYCMWPKAWLCPPNRLVCTWHVMEDRLNSLHHVSQQCHQVSGNFFHPPSSYLGRRSHCWDSCGVMQTFAPCPMQARVVNHIMLTYQWSVQIFMTIHIQFASCSAIMARSMWQTSGQS